MRRGLWLILLGWTTSLAAQVSYFGPPLPLTNTRYGALDGTPVLVTNGNETFIFLSTEHNVRMVALADAQRIARPVLDATDADAAWDGSRFFVAGTSGTTIVGRFVDVEDRQSCLSSFSSDRQDCPSSTILENATKPRLAWPLMLFARNDGVQAVVLSADGAAHDFPTDVAAYASDFDVATNGSETFALVTNDDGVKLLSLARDGAVLSETRIGDAAEHVSIVNEGEDFLARWSSEEGTEAAIVHRNGAVEKTEVIAPPEPPPVVNGAFEQSLAATASTPNAALVVWNEDDDVRAGIRGANASWTERTLATNARAIAAASDGREFIVLLENGATLLLDPAGSLIAQSPPIDAFEARDVALNASGAAVIGVDGNRIKTARVHRDGGVTEAIELRADATNPVIATDGTNFLAVWQTSALAIESLRLGVDAAPSVVFDANGEEPAVAFNGREFVVVWRGGEYVRGRRVRIDGTAIREFVQIGRPGGTPPRAIRLTGLGDGKVGLTWLDGRAQLVTFDAWDVQTAKGIDTRTSDAARIVALPHDGLGIAMTDTLDDAPHHGSSRVLLSVARPAPAPSPTAPRATVTQVPGKINISWTPSSDATGYRVEYRLDNGAWLEAEGWATGTSFLFDPKRPGLYAIRVRAMGDGGASAYSEPVEITVSARRRAVR